MVCTPLQNSPTYQTLFSWANFCCMNLYFNPTLIRMALFYSLLNNFNNNEYTWIWIFSTMLVWLKPGIFPVSMNTSLFQPNKNAPKSIFIFVSWYHLLTPDMILPLTKALHQKTLLSLPPPKKSYSQKDAPSTSHWLTRCQVAPIKQLFFFKRFCTRIRVVEFGLY